MSITTEIGYWRPVTEWCLGANDTLPTCFLAMVGNHHVIVTTANGSAEVMSDGEIEYADEAMTKVPPGTYAGDSVVAMLTYWAAHGWPCDPMLKPVAWRPIEQGEIRETISDAAAAYAWFMLPKGPDGQWDFSDDAVKSDAPGVGAHAMLIVGSQPDGSWMVVTWATLKNVSDAWLKAYGRGYFQVIHPAWRNPHEDVAHLA